MKATTYPNDDDRGFISVVIELVHLALTPAAPHPTVAESTPKLSWLDRFDQWAARSRQREREAYLAGSKDVFDLETRIRLAERQAYY